MDYILCTIKYLYIYQRITDILLITLVVENSFHSMALSELRLTGFYLMTL